MNANGCSPDGDGERDVGDGDGDDDGDGDGDGCFEVDGMNAGRVDEPPTSPTKAAACRNACGMSVSPKSRPNPCPVSRTPDCMP